MRSNGGDVAASNFIIHVTKRIEHDYHLAIMAIVAYLSNKRSEYSTLQENSLT